MVFVNLYLMCLSIAVNAAYTNNHFTISKFSVDEAKHFTCKKYEGSVEKLKFGKWKHGRNKLKPLLLTLNSKQESTERTESTEEMIDPYILLQLNIIQVIFGSNSTDYFEEKKRLTLTQENTTNILHHPDGKVFRDELFRNRSGVHLPLIEFIHRGYCILEVTKDYMQTAVNAFAIILHGNLDDIARLPADYILRSARTIAMMKIAKEKLAAMWNVVKGNQETSEISYETLAIYRPLFKYVNGKEMSRLNLSDPRILSYLGTHADLGRHKVGLIASRYINLNHKWAEPRYLNLMNNILCGVPMTNIRKVPESTFLQLSHQVFYHIHACDPLQRRFYLALMMRTQVLGKAYSWTASDVSRLGLLLAEVPGPELSTINPKAIAGITSQVMLTMLPQNLQHLTEAQLVYIGQKARNILARKLKNYQDNLQIYGNGSEIYFASIWCRILLHSMLFQLMLNILYTYLVL